MPRAAERLALGAFSPYDTQTETRYRDLILRQLSSDKNRLPGIWREKTRQRLEAARQWPDRAEWAERVIIKLGFPSGKPAAEVAFLISTQCRTISYVLGRLMRVFTTKQYISAGLHGLRASPSRTCCRA
jgi:hypothetical protein